MAYVGFGKLTKKLSKQPGVTDAKGLAAAIGMKKYGKAQFQKATASGKKLGPAK